MEVYQYFSLLFVYCVLLCIFVLLRHFLYETKQGYSAHFATAAVMMFRMFGVPARYVTGYAIPKNLFTLQPDGTWSAVAQDDNAHAWAEVYLEGIGWTPVEMTPGMLAEEQEVFYDAELTELEGTRMLLRRLKRSKRLSASFLDKSQQ